MNLIKPSYKIEHITPNILQLLEHVGRTCYKTEDKITQTSAEKFVLNRRTDGHFPVLEFADMIVRIVCDRGVSHELVRHRLCSFAQESTRYCNYKGGVTFVIPPWIIMEPGEYTEFHKHNMFDSKDNDKEMWYENMLHAEQSYQYLLREGWSPQQARSVLPNSLKTEIVIKANLVEWRHIFKMRTSTAAHPQMREIMIPLLKETKERIPVMFDDLE